MLLAQHHDDQDVGDEGDEQDDRHDVAVDWNSHFCFEKKSIFTSLIANLINLALQVS